MRKKDREITDKGEIEQVLRRARTLRLAMCRDNLPHITPMSYGYADGVIWMHSSPVGHKVEILKANPRVAFEVETDVEYIPALAACDYTVRYQSVVGHGTVQFVTDPAEKLAGLDLIMAHYSAGRWEFPERIVAITTVLKLPIDSMTGKRANWS